MPPQPGIPGVTFEGPRDVCFTEEARGTPELVCVGEGTMDSYPRNLWQLLQDPGFELKSQSWVHSAGGGAGLLPVSGLPVSSHLCCGHLSLIHFFSKCLFCTCRAAGRGLSTSVREAMRVENNVGFLLSKKHPPPGQFECF